jgi:hypothetical protein
MVSALRATGEAPAAEPALIAALSAPGAHGETPPKKG